MTLSKPDTTTSSRSPSSPSYQRYCPRRKLRWLTAAARPCSAVSSSPANRVVAPEYRGRRFPVDRLAHPLTIRAGTGLGEYAFPPCHLDDSPAVILGCCRFPRPTLASSPQPRDRAGKPLVDRPSAAKRAPVKAIRGILRMRMADAMIGSFDGYVQEESPVTSINPPGKNSRPPWPDAVRRHLDGDRTAMTEIVRQVQPWLYRIARGYRLAPYAAEDVVQNTLLALLPTGRPAAGSADRGRHGCRWWRGTRPCA